MNPEQKRKDRLRQLNKSIQKATEEHGCASKKAIMGLVAYDWGCRDEKTLNYLSVLENAGFIKIMGDEITHLFPNINDGNSGTESIGEEDTQTG